MVLVGESKTWTKAACPPLCFLTTELVSDSRVGGLSVLCMRVIAVPLERPCVKWKEHGLWIQLKLGSSLGSGLPWWQSG